MSDPATTVPTELQLHRIRSEVARPHSFSADDVDHLLTFLGDLTVDLNNATVELRILNHTAACVATLLGLIVVNGFGVDLPPVLAKDLPCVPSSPKTPD